jgi:hypothetical protein
MPLEFDNKISLGHVISVGVILIGGMVAFFDLRGQQSQLASEVVTISRAADAREVRLRSVEIAQASQTSDLRTIQVGIGKIEAQLQKLVDKP